MWLFLLFATYLPISAVVHDVEIICSVGTSPYESKFEACPMYRTTGFLPFCVYMRVPSTETTRGTNVYGCVYSKDLPRECVERGEYYTDWATVTFRGNKTVSGAMMCCNQKYCNRADDVMVSMVRLKANKRSETIWVPIVFSVFLIITALLPLFHWYTEKRHLQDSQRAEHSEPIRENLALADQTEVQVGEPTEMVCMAFDEYEEIEYLMKQMAGEQRTLGTTNTSCTNPTFTGSKLKGQEAGFEEEEMATNLEITRVPKATVVMKDADFPHRVKRLFNTKFDRLAMKMIEHGPYGYNFDPIELGELFESCMEIFKREPTLLRLRAHEKTRKRESSLVVYGNLEGNYGDLFRWFHKNGWPFKTTVVFLGGLTSPREEFSLETLVLILALKKMLPDRVYVLRGPSEVYPFCFKKRMPLQLANCLTEALSRTFDYLPLAATINDTILLCHGGVTKNIRHVRQIENISRPLKDIHMGTIAADLIFSKVGSEQRLIEGARGTCLNYDQNLEIATHSGAGIKFLIRARNSCPQGFLIHSGKMMTLWSSTNEIPELDAEIGTEWDCGVAASVLINLKRPKKKNDMPALEMDFCVLMPHMTRYEGKPKFGTEAARTVARMRNKEEKKKTRAKWMSAEKKMLKRKELINQMGLASTEEVDGAVAVAPPVVVAAAAKPSAQATPLKQDNKKQ